MFLPSIHQLPPDAGVRSANDTSKTIHFKESADYGKVKDELIEMLTKQTTTFPRTYLELNHTVKNFADLTQCLFGDDSIIGLAVREISEHVKAHERAYTHLFNDKWFFGASFIDRVYFRVQTFLRSCTTGDIARVDIHALNLRDFLEIIYLNEFIPTRP